MLSAKEIKELMDAIPFKPFRICLSDGKIFEVTNHDGAMVARNSVEVAVNHDAEGIAERFVRCAIMHITRIEQLQPA